MTAAVIIDGVRTPRGKGSRRGALHETTPLRLVTGLIDALRERGLPADLVEEFLLGCATQAGEQGQNLARTAVLRSGLGDHVPAATLNRFCASGLDACNLAAARIRCGDAGLAIAGGVESVSRVPMFSDGGALYGDPDTVEALGSVHMGIAADLIATREGFSREELDDYAARTRSRARRAHADGRASGSLVPVVDDAGAPRLTRDELLDFDPSREDLAALPPAFADAGADGQDARVLKRFPELDHVRHLHTRASSPALADASALLVMAREDIAHSADLRPRARIVATATCADDPVVMLTAGQDAIGRVLTKAGLAAADLDVVEFAEAFAAGCLRAERQLEIDPERFNPGGGTIALGHAFGATGAILLIQALDELERTGGRYGVAAVSGAAGLGVATLIERL